jgi:YegS/Rv2252/BmrU family lipid kinase
MPRRALLIVNAKSRSGAAQCEIAIERLKDHGIEPVHLECGRREDLSPLIAKHAKDVDCAIVGGGDGTLNAAAFGVMGTANDLARTLGIPFDLDGAADVIADGFTRKIDLGIVNGEPFFNVASIGLSAELAQKLTRDIKRRWGRLGYALVALQVLAQAKPFRATIYSEEESVRVKTLQIAVGNGRFYGGGNAVEKDASIDDQHLDLYSLELDRAWKLALMARSFRHGQHGAWEEVRAVRAKEFDIRTRKPKPVNADGEIVTQTPAHFSIRPAAVTVFAPKAGA